MPVPLFRLLAVAACLVAVPPVFAHQDDAAQDLPPPLDCDHPPKGAPSAVPDPVAEWAQLDCKPYGQFLVQREGWVWRYPVSGTSEVTIPARTGDDKRKPTVVYTLVAVNDVEQTVLIHFLYHSDADIWGVVCAPECRSEQVFKVYRREQ